MNKTVSLLTLLGISAAAATSAAQEVRLDRYAAPTTPEDGLRLSRPIGLGHQRLSGLLVMDYANDPLVLELEQGLTETESAKLVNHQLQAQARIAYGLFDRLVIDAGFDVALVMAGENFEDPRTATPLGPSRGAGVGDARLGARYVALGDAESLAAFALQSHVTLPLASSASESQSLRGEPSATVHPELLGEVKPGAFRVTANAGFLARERTEVLGTPVDDELTFGLGAAARLPGRFKSLEALVEVYGSTDSSDLFGREGTPLEALVGGRWKAAEQWLVTLAGGPGLQRGIGSPDMRALASIGFIAVPELDADHDGVNDELDGCLNAAEDVDGFQDDDGCPDLDNDGDRVPDESDRCSDQAEDLDSFEDTDGCPDLDDDADGVADEQDQCRRESEDRDGFQDEDGCPDLDNDADGVPDAVDRCGDAAEDRDQFEDEDGCPDLDNDADGMADAEDACPLTPGSPAEKGCASAQLEGSQIRIRQRIEFESNQNVLLPGTESVLEDVRRTLEQNPQVRLLAIEGHTDAIGSPEVNQNLSERRAVRVVEWLVEHGIPADRLTAWGCGANRPLEDNATLEGRKTNRRVELHIVDPAPEQPRSTEGCRAAPNLGR